MEEGYWKWGVAENLFRHGEALNQSLRVVLQHLFQLFDLC